MYCVKIFRCPEFFGLFCECPGTLAQESTSATPLAIEVMFTFTKKVRFPKPCSPCYKPQPQIIQLFVTKEQELASSHCRSNLTTLVNLKLGGEILQGIGQAISLWLVEKFYPSSRFSYSRLF